MRQTTREIAVVLLNWNAADDTCRCLARMNQWAYLQPHIVVVDNGSTDDSVHRISMEFPKVELILGGENRGFSGGNNVALKAMFDVLPKSLSLQSSPFFLLLNNDAFIDEKNLIVLVESLAANPEVGVTGPLLFADNTFLQLLSAGGLNPAHNGRTYWANAAAENYVARMKNPYEVDYVSGTVALLRGSVLQEVGFFDENYFFSGEMADLCERMKRKGYKCTVHPAAKAYHDMHSTGKNRDTLYLYYSLRNRFLYIRKFRQNQLLRLFLFWTLIAGKGMLKATFTMNFSRARALFLALRDGWSGKFGGKNELFIDHH